MNYPIRTPRRKPRPSIAGIATRAAVAYGTYKVASWAWSKWSGSSSNEAPNDLNNANNEASYQNSMSASIRRDTNKNTRTRRKNFIRRRKRSIDKCYIEAINALEMFMDSLRQSIESQTDYSHETKRLKQIRKRNSKEGRTNNNSLTIDQEHLWKIIKIKSITRMIAMLYVNTILHLLLTVQIHVLGGCMFRESQSNEDGSLDKVDDNDHDGDDNDYFNKNVQKNQRINKDTHTAVLIQTYEYFFQSGIIALLDQVKLVVEKATEKWISIDESNNLGTVSFHDFSTAINIIRSLEKDGIILGFVLPSKEDGDESQSALGKSLIDETFDIMESPVFDEAMHDCLQTSFQILESELQAHVFDGKEVGYIHLVHVFGKLKKITNRFYEKPQSVEDAELWWDDKFNFPNIFIQAMDRLETLKELGDVSFN